MSSNFTENIEQRIKILQQVHIFENVDLKTLRMIASVLEEYSVFANTNIFKKGDKGSSMYIIVNGKLKVHDEDYIFDEIEAGHVFGEYSLLDTESRSASVTAITNTHLMKLKQEDFYGLLVDNSEVTKGIIKVLTWRLRQKNIFEEQLAYSHKKIKEQNDQITASLTYAQKIQSVVLPSSSKMRALLKNYFVFYRPRDLVSGDFYWLTEKAGKVFLAVSDCTGHGVPGALMAMTGSMMLSQIIKENNIYEVDLILQDLHNRVSRLFTQGELTVQDGMDIAICAIDFQKKELEFAGAKGALVFSENGTIQTIRGTRSPIGGFEYTTKKRVYEKHKLKLKPQSTYYMFSDGYADQFGHTGKKLKKKQFLNLLQEISIYPLENQQQMLGQHLDNWQKNAPQTDDILVLGFQV